MESRASTKPHQLATMAERELVIGILSIGDMGVGIGKLLISQGYKVATFAEDRSEHTRERAKSSGIELLSSIAALVSESACILSIVPPRDALTTAQRVADVTSSEASTRENPLYYLDLNAIAPSHASQIESLFAPTPNIIFIDGGIIGGPPRLKPDAPIGWTRPSIVVSGPTKLPYIDLAQTLNIDHITDTIGPASGLKMCFASTTKGFIAIAIQSLVTAEAMGVYPQLRGYLEKHNKEALAIADRGVVSMPPKAYRWVNEMQQIGRTMEEEGGFSSGLFDGVAEVYRVVAEDTALGLEQPGRRQRGLTVDDVVTVMREGMKATKQKLD
ncbi:6-phosphogluconate dehydrogenase [Aspergillus granulosus]|uniref:6-phosphogluconate dehydrogenase n=1 Tax=Aspergillus granulosus TaxID=176169 RepID=A0ABR4GRJ0_9EURO